VNLAILNDAKLRPELFVWAGMAEPARIAGWVQQQGWRVPDDLIELWVRTGGGDFFESETLFAPFSNLFAQDNLEIVNSSLWSRGMPKDLLAIHDGMQFTALVISSAQYAFVDEESFRIKQLFANLDSWYLTGIRPLFEEKYCLDSP
jgi:hypothetical protein